jgi:hypothetical protein
LCLSQAQIFGNKYKIDNSLSFYGVDRIIDPTNVEILFLWTFGNPFERHLEYQFSLWLFQQTFSLFFML